MRGKIVRPIQKIKTSINLSCLLSGTCPRRPGRHHAPGHVDHAGLDQLVAAARGLHQGHRRLVKPLRHFRLPRTARVRSRQLRCTVRQEYFEGKKSFENTISNQGNEI